MSFERGGGVVVPFPQGGRAGVRQHAVMTAASVVGSEAHAFARRRHVLAIVRGAWRDAADWVVLGGMLTAAAVYAAAWVVVFRAGIF